MKKIIILLALLTIATTTYATTINIPTDYSTIQAGIDAASDYDTVLVDTGTYVENIDFNGKNITVASLFLTTQDTSYISQTVIDGDSSGSVVTFDSGEDSTAIFKGFTITKGEAEKGGGIFSYESSPILENVMINGNSASDGGGIYCYDNSSPSLVNVIITDNTAFSGGGIYCEDNTNPFLENVTIANNFAYYGGGIYSHSSSICLLNCIVWNNSSQGIYISNSTIITTYSDIEGGWIGTGNINSDPLFVDPTNGDYHLSWANYPNPDSTMSPCIDAGDPDSPLDPDGTIADMGAYYYNQNQAVDDEPENITQNSFISYPNPISAKPKS